MNAETQPTQFETLFKLIPLGEDITARVERAEAILGLMLQAIRKDSGIETRFDEPVPNMFAVEKVLNLYRTPEERVWESMYDDPGYNPW